MSTHNRYTLFRCATDSGTKDWAIRVEGSTISLLFGTTGKQLREQVFKDIPLAAANAVARKQKKVEKDGYFEVGEAFFTSDGKFKGLVAEQEKKVWAMEKMPLGDFLKGMDKLVSGIYEYNHDMQNIGNAPLLEVESDLSVPMIKISCKGLLAKPWELSFNNDAIIRNDTIVCAGKITSSVEQVFIYALAAQFGLDKVSIVATKDNVDRKVLPDNFKRQTVFGFIRHEAGLFDDRIGLYLAEALGIVPKPMVVYKKDAKPQGRFAVTF
jgi:hypothetical protein